MGTSTKEILEYAQKIVNKKLDINYSESKTGDIAYSVLNVDKVKKILGKDNFMSVYDGMEKMFDYVKKELDK